MLRLELAEPMLDLAKPPMQRQPQILETCASQAVSSRSREASGNRPAGCQSLFSSYSDFPLLQLCRPARPLPRRFQHPDCVDEWSRVFERISWRVRWPHWQSPSRRAVVRISEMAGADGPVDHGHAFGANSGRE
jgi:hypothetical protein